MIEPFKIATAQADLDDLRARLHATRWPDAVTDDWSQGTPPGALRTVVDYWANDFDWRASERALNEFDHVKVDGIHAVRHGTPGATPLLLIHGWPDGFIRFARALPLLESRFEIVVPSIPGYGFSDRPTEPWGPVRIADQLAGLMSTLGHERFGVHGADIGTHIADQLAVRHPQRLTGLHLGDIPIRRMRALDPAGMSEAEHEWARNAQIWDLEEGGYSHEQRTKPQTLAAALTDSPAGLASWVLEKFESWTDGDFFDVYSLDELSTNLSIYWFTNTVASAARYYRDGRLADYDNARVDVPTGVAQFPHDLLPAPRESAERFYRIERWTRMSRGGHFGPWEQPDAWSAEITAFFDQLGV